MILGLLLGFAAVTAHSPAAETKLEPGDETLQQALECRVYAELAQYVHKDNPVMHLMDRKLLNYWQKRGDELGLKEGRSPDALSLQQLIIPIKPERFKPVLLGCLAMTPKKALR